MTLTFDRNLFQGHSDPLPTRCGFFLKSGQDLAKGKKYGLNLEMKDICDDLCIWPIKNGSKWLHTCYLQKLFKWSMTKLEYNGERILSSKQFSYRGHDLDFWPINFAQGHCTPVTKRLSVSEVWVWFAKGRKYMVRSRILYINLLWR